MQLSVVITNFNEAENLRGALQSVAFTDEVIVVDGGSTDNSLEVAKKFGAKVFVRDNPPQLNINKNFGFEKATRDWILSLDTDERIPSSLAGEIQKIIQDPSAANGYFIKRRNFFGKKWLAHGGWCPDAQLRLFRKGKGNFECKHIHEMLKVDGKIGELENSFDHLTYKDLSDYWRKFIRYTKFEAEKLKEFGVNHRFPFLYYVFKEPLELFWDKYFVRRGFLDGWEGLIVYFFSSLYPAVAYLRFKFSSL